MPHDVRISLCRAYAGCSIVVLFGNAGIGVIEQRAGEMLADSVSMRGLDHDGHRQVEQVALFYEFSLERHVPCDHLLRSIDRFVELGELRRELAPFYSAIGRPSVDPEPMIRMLIVGYCFGIRSERPLCEEVHLKLGVLLVLPPWARW